MLVPILKNSNSNINLFDSFIDNFFTFPTFKTPMTTTPVHDVIENENEYIVDFHLAGIKKEDVSINLENDVLSIKAERHVNNDLNYTYKESFSGVYHKSFTLPESIDSNKINASFVDGIVKVIIPKKLEKKKLSSKKIEIN